MKQNIYGMNLWHLPSFKFFILYVGASNNYELIIIQVSDTFLSLISTIADSQYIEFVRYNLKVLPCL
jgi:hypothetical protein